MVVDEFKPLPVWKQRWRAARAAWRRSKDRRRRVCATLAIAGRRGLTLAISMVGVILISYGVWSIHHSAGYVVAGLLLWGIQWNYGKEEGGG